MRMVLHAEHLTVGYGRTAVVEDMTLTIEKGEIVTLIGANGAGKSTILKTLAAQLAPLSGCVMLDGREKMPPEELAKYLSVMLTGHIHPELMTCYEVAASGRYPYTGRFGILSQHDKDVIAAKMALTAVTELKDTPFDKLSDGQKQRVMLARALCQEPDILIMDEPTSYLDIRHKVGLLTLVRQLVREGLSVVMSLHELELAERVADRIVCIREGHIDRIGTPEEIFSGNYIRELFAMDEGGYEALYGVPELPAVRGTPEVIVIGGGGTGVPVYRMLQRKGIPFAAGVLHENDLDYPAALALASVVIPEHAFQSIRPDTLQRAMDVMVTCREVICCCKKFGEMNARNEQLLMHAKEMHLLTEDSLILSG